MGPVLQRSVRPPPPPPPRPLLPPLPPRPPFCAPLGPAPPTLASIPSSSSTSGGMRLCARFWRFTQARFPTSLPAGEMGAPRAVDDAGGTCCCSCSSRKRATSSTSIDDPVAPSPPSYESASDIVSSLRGSGCGVSIASAPRLTNLSRVGAAHSASSFSSSAWISHSSARSDDLPALKGLFGTMFADHDAMVCGARFATSLGASTITLI